VAHQRAGDPDLALGSGQLAAAGVDGEHAVIPRMLRVATALSASVLMTGWALHLRQQQPFDHARHARLFVSCTTCHAGITEAGTPVFPPISVCANCHNGTVQPRVSYQPPAGPRPGNLRFDHQQHAARRAGRGDSSSCADCHEARPAVWMHVHGPQAAQCVSCHTNGQGTHLALPDSACGTCHVPLAQATALPVDSIRGFPVPPSHHDPGFVLAGGHGALARRFAGPNGVAQSCATCHARDFCTSCHVDAPEVAPIQALAPDSRSLVLPHTLPTPPSHTRSNFESRHGPLAGASGSSCRTCHTRESCTTCHRGEAPSAVQALYAAGAGRGNGARTVASAPSSHQAPHWNTQHGTIASASMRTCTSCHTRAECLTCHKPDPSDRGGYHPPGYLATHPSDAYTRASSCSDCHNTGQFCQSCHQLSGLTARRALLGASGYHDGNRQFFVGHGQAARQSLESCVSCHTEQDCLTCHSVVKGRGFDPHGPGFNPVEMLRKNPQLCVACHGTAIPTRRPG
jgi:hypothetical protein